MCQVNKIVGCLLCEDWIDGDGSSIGGGTIFVFSWCYPMPCFFLVKLLLPLTGSVPRLKGLRVSLATLLKLLIAMMVQEFPPRLHQQMAVTGLHQSHGEVLGACTVGTGHYASITWKYWCTGSVSSLGDFSPPPHTHGTIKLESDTLYCMLV